ncbi:MAG: hypothetical protein COV74_09220 [Candidatus Omnitrophica bacterium CG11_big_fil_rev_8_21_14_0_20_45_26]|uniref:NodB homology domain-containing protein n=1 Tax=Candidatus Abzuiibacterium crystallinum TaxID=1974748 RepID=A0A2H0LLU6_9BACT|nr:MAG: hypothetical protein COV74_09220 [Candidatus Omnitrophica bacterium CG11_big_fil_rev_8_21_14_0_20_45_26]PIW63251.1 MAG: hypothetical protein COW12_11195 [Candidatus Omnitrophica bacterium CG12_big_fil_rev_8_21_14_0_65_45_16]
MSVKQIAFRMDDVGAASKQHEVYGKTRVQLGNWRIPFPGNFLWVKYLKPFRQWGPYAELSVDQWGKLLALCERIQLKLTIGITAGWVEKNGSVTAFPTRYPEQAKMIKTGLKMGCFEVANHGYTHCVLNNCDFRPKYFSSNRQWHREFWEWVPLEVQRSHIEMAQTILQDYFEDEVVTFIPPGNVFTNETLKAASEYGLKYVSCQRLKSDTDTTLIPIPDQNVFAFHDKEVQELGIQWLEDQCQQRQPCEFVFIKQIGKDISSTALS